MVTGAAVTREHASSSVVRIHHAPPVKRSRGRRQSAGLISQRYVVQLHGLQPRNGPLAQLADAAPSNGEGSGFDSRAAYQDLPRWRNGIRAGLRNQILPVRVRGGAPEATDGWQSGNAPVLKTEMVSEPGRVGSIPTPSAIDWSVARVAMGRLAKPQPVGNRREGSIPSRSAISISCQLQ
jgi:hypothetical protein